MLILILQEVISHEIIDTIMPTIVLQNDRVIEASSLIKTLQEKNGNYGHHEH